jgi:predicted nuclease of restriction endonuclease-like (RecB) superfamily
MGKCKDDLEREFYIRMTRKFGWSKNVLIHQIENQTYEKTLLSQTNFEISDKEHFVDFLLYNRRMRCLDFLSLRPAQFIPSVGMD